ncbi:TerC family protein [Enterovirga sp.]|uniref:TerC family protein n=1 Tax=Enterovirga sp. TaxID=2026350 RepID=UPI002CC51BA8|nr:TerC family protein [Enterovirga sp.]HMO29096.1 TerC family protein [Enterovirga sp.]
MEMLGPHALKLFEIIWINIILSGDNAVVIALACRGLPADKQRLGMILGAGVAVALRVVFTVLVASLLSVPYLKIMAGLLLLWVAVKLIPGEDEGDGSIAESDKLWHAVKTIAIADAIMSLDNVLAIAGVAKDSTLLLIIGLLISIPLIVAGASLIMMLLEKLPILVWAGAALLGWVALEMILTDPALLDRVGEARLHTLELPGEIAGALFVLLAGYLLLRRKNRRKEAAEI